MLFALAALGATAMAADPDPARIDAIWSAARDRMLTQQDIWFDDGDFPACIQILKVEAERYPSDYDMWTNLGWMQENVEDWDSALATYIRYDRDNPQDPDAALPLAYYYFEKKLYSKLPELLEPSIKRKCHPNNFRLLARAYEMQKMFSDSVRVWKVYLQRDPNDGAAKMNLARVEKKLAAKT
jgi:tetratricopeptide (TPR) repeat protein